MKLEQAVKGIKITVVTKKQMVTVGLEKGNSTKDGEYRTETITRDCTPDDVLAFNEESGILVTKDGQKYRLYK